MENGFKYSYVLASSDGGNILLKIFPRSGQTTPENIEILQKVVDENPKKKNCELEKLFNTRHETILMCSETCLKSNFYFCGLMDALMLHSWVPVCLSSGREIGDLPL